MRLEQLAQAVQDVVACREGTGVPLGSPDRQRKTLADRVKIRLEQVYEWRHTPGESRLP